jgi:hypothetical protein
MKPSAIWNLQFKLTTKTITVKDIFEIDDYICFQTKLCFYHLQKTTEINKVYSLSVLLLHYFLNRLLHFRTNFHFFVKHYLNLEFEPENLTTNFSQCICIYCKFPNVKLEKIDQSLQQYFQTLQKHSQPVQEYMLSVLEKCFELQNLHSLILQCQYPHLNTDVITHFVLSYKK